MKEKWKKILNYETVSYVIAGVLTTAVDYIVFALVNEGDGIVGYVVHGVDAAAEYVHHDVVTAQLVLMDHGILLVKLP